MSRKKEDLKKDADQVLQGIRIVLPGTQALMGFQLIAFFNPSFQTLPTDLKYLHFTTLLLIITCSILLIAPVAFQQIGEEGRTTNSFLTYTRKLLGVAMLFLLLAIVGDVYLAAKILQLSSAVAIGISAAILSLGVILWFVRSLIRKNYR